jgi:transcriptional regulator with XRE-family HTH domain
MTIDAFLKSPRSAQARRGSVRRKLRLDTVGKAAARGSTPVEIHDLSTSGMLIETSVDLTVGEAIEIELPRTGPQTAEVIWASGRFYGCRFAEPIPPAAISAALLRSRPTDPSASGLEAPEQVSPDFGSRISHLRTAKGLSLQDLADRLEVSRQAVWYWESGQRLPRAELFQKLAQTLGTSEHELLAPAPPAQAAVASGWDEEFKRAIAERLGVQPEQVSIVVTI